MVQSSGFSSNFESQQHNQVNLAALVSTSTIVSSGIFIDYSCPTVIKSPMLKIPMYDFEVIKTTKDYSDASTHVDPAQTP